MSTNETKRGITKVLILVSLLVLPGFLYFLLEKKASNRYQSLPIYGEKVLTGTSTRKMGTLVPDTLFHRVPLRELLNDKGEAVEFPKQDTSISVVNVFFTRCETFCEAMNREMQRVATYFERNPRLRLYTLSLDTAFDSPEILAEYAHQRFPERDGEKWTFLTSTGSGTTDMIHLIRSGLLVDAVHDTTREASFIHSSALILLDSERRIRGYYDTTHKKEVDRLIDEIKVLLVEEIRRESNAKIEQAH